MQKSIEIQKFVGWHCRLDCTGRVQVIDANTNTVEWAETSCEHFILETTR